MDDDQSMEEIRCDLDKQRIPPYKKTWRPHQNTVLVQFKARPEERIAVLSDTITRKHCLRFVLRKRYAWRRSYTTKYISLQGCLVLYWSRIRKVDNRINLIKKQENPQTTKAHREVTEKPAAATSTTEYQASLILQSNNRTRIAEKQSTKSWFSSSRNTRTRSFSCRTSEEIKTFSERLGKLITDMGNTEIFELCETSSKKQCPDCASSKIVHVEDV